MKSQGIKRSNSNIKIPSILAKKPKFSQSNQVSCVSVFYTYVFALYCCRYFHDHRYFYDYFRRPPAIVWLSMASVDIPSMINFLIQFLLLMWRESEMKLRRRNRNLIPVITRNSVTCCWYDNMVPKLYSWIGIMLKRRVQDFKRLVMYPVLQSALMLYRTADYKYVNNCILNFLTWNWSDCIFISNLIL